MKQYTIKTLEELNEIDEKTFSKLEDISFKLPNGEQVNVEAEFQAWRTLEDRRGIYRVSKLNLKSGLKSSFDPNNIIVLPIFLASLVISIPIELSSMRKAKKEAYKRFCELRDKINEAYKIPVSYRSYPVLEHRIIGD